MKVDRKTADLHRRQIVDAAGRLYRRHGPAGVSLAEVMREAGLTHGGFYGHFDSKDELVGTASWHTNSDDGRSARIGWVFVRHPGFGLGRRLVTEVEARAQQSGFSQLAVSATANSVPFFERLGYQVASRGVRHLGPDCALPVAFMRKFLMRPVRARLS